MTTALALAVLIAVLPLPADAPSILTPTEAVARALAHRPETGAARAEQRRAESSLAEAEAALLPRLDLTGSVIQFQEPMIVTPIHGFDFQAFPEFDETLIQGDLRLDYTLYDGGVRRGAVSRQEAELGVAAASMATTEQALVARTLAEYLRVLGLEATLSAADRRIDAVTAERRRVQQLLEVGRAPEVDLRRAEAALAAARAARVRLRAALETAERDLGRLVGEAEGRVAAATLLPVSVAEAGVPPRQALYLELEESPPVVRARQALKAAEAAVEVARGGRRPRLALVGDLKEYGSSRGDFDLEWNAGLRVAVPIFRGGALEERVAWAETARDAASERLRLARLNVQAELDRVVAALAEAGAREEALAEAVAQYEEVARIERLRLDTGVGIQADYLDAEAALLDARAGLVEAGNAVVGARVEVARVTGALDLEWVEESLRTPLPQEGP